MYTSLLTYNLRESDALRYAEESVGLFPRSLFIYTCLFSYLYITFVGCVSCIKASFHLYFFFGRVCGFLFMWIGFFAWLWVSFHVYRSLLNCKLRGPDKSGCVTDSVGLFCRSLFMYTSLFWTASCADLISRDVWQTQWVSFVGLFSFVYVSFVGLFSCT